MSLTATTSRSRTAIKLRAVALDFDGTIADGGQVQADVRAAILDVRARGIAVVLVTGRILNDLRCESVDLALFDAVVAENGSVLAFPKAGRSSVLGAAPPERFVRALRERGLDPRLGSCVVECEASAGPAVLDAIRATELPLVIHFNRGRLMVLPQGISKGTGLRAALRAMRISAHNAVAVGDAENDHELLASCEVGAAVEWGSRALGEAADLVIRGTGPAAVAEFVRRTAAAGSIEPPAPWRHRLLLGRDDQGAVVALAMRGRNVLIAGDPRSGKSWIAGLLCEQLVMQDYTVCVIDPEGDYEPLEALPGVELLGGEDPPPTMHELSRRLRHPGASLVLGLARLRAAEKRDYVARVLELLAVHRRETGIPHRIVVDEAHYFLHEPSAARLLDDPLAGYSFVTYRVSSLLPEILAATECAIVTRESDAAEALLLHRAFRGTESVEHWQQTLANLDIDQAVLLPISEESGGRLRRLRIAPRLTHHVRHRHKYVDVSVAEGDGFRIAFDGDGSGPLVRSLSQLVDVLACVDQRRIQGHVRRGDLSRWIADVIRDHALAASVSALEERARLGQLPDFSGAVIRAVSDQYGLPDAFL